jgi:hypothetical protein
MLLSVILLSLSIVVVTVLLCSVIDVTFLSSVTVRLFSCELLLSNGGDIVIFLSGAGELGVFVVSLPHPVKISIMVKREEKRSLVYIWNSF